MESTLNGLIARGDITSFNGKFATTRIWYNKRYFLIN